MPRRSHRGALIKPIAPQHCGQCALRVAIGSRQERRTGGMIRSLSRAVTRPIRGLIIGFNVGLRLPAYATSWDLGCIAC